MSFKLDSTIFKAFLVEEYRIFSFEKLVMISEFPFLFLNKRTQVSTDDLHHGRDESNIPDEAQCVHSNVARKFKLRNRNTNKCKSTT